MFRFSVVYLSIALIFAFCAPFCGAQDERPNIVLIIADDLGWDDCSPYGNTGLATPNLQRLADEGLKFEKAFVTTGSGSASRASIITGQYPTTTDADELHWSLPREKVTFVEKLKSSGYWTGAAGKWHLGEAMKTRFNRVIETDNRYASSGADSESAWMKLIDSRDSKKPFFFWLAATDPVRPFSEETPTINAEDIKVPPYHPDTPEVRKDYQGYYGKLAKLDRQVGKVMEKLEAMGVLKQTMIVFLSDNGRPFPRDKTTLYDSGIRSPFIVRWPSVIDAGGVCQEVVSSIDLARTCMQVARITKVPPNFKGRSFLPQMIDPQRPGREYIFAEKNWHQFEDHARAVRNKRYKYIRNYYDDLPLTPCAEAIRSTTYEEMKRLGRSDSLQPHQLTCFLAPRAKEELYDTVADPFELRNVASDPRYASVVLAMRAALKSWESTNEDSPPKLRTADEYDRVTGLPTNARVTPRRSKATMVAKKLTAP